MKKAIAMFLVIVLSLFVITACQVENEESGAGTASNNSSVVSDTSEANSSEEESTESSDVSITETSENTSIPEETSEDTSIPEETSEDTSDNEIASQIYAIFDTIFATEIKDKFEFEIMEEFPDEVAAIVAFGEDAFPTLNEIISDGSSLEKQWFAKYVKYTIKPELYDHVFTSPDEKYAIKATVSTFATELTIGILYDLELVNCETDEVLLTINETNTNVSVEWSQDSRYASISNGNRYFGTTIVTDTKEVKLIKLPDEYEIESIVQEKFNNSYDIYSGPFYFSFGEWVDENKIKISILLTDTQTLEYEGWYIYDLNENKIVEYDILKSKNN